MGSLLRPCLAAVAALMLVSSRPAVAAPSSAAKAVEGEGCVREGEGACKAASVGQVVSPQSTFVAGKGGASLQFSDQTIVRLSEGAEVRLLPRTKVQLSAKEETPAQVLELKKGKVFVTLAGAPIKSAMMIKAAHQMTAIIKHGAAVVKLVDDGMVLGALSGDALLAAGNDWNDVHTGKVRVIKKTDPKGTVRDLIATPEILPSRGMQLLVGGGKGEPPKIAWKPVAGAEAYEVEVRSGSGAPTYRRVPKGQTEAVFPELGPGNHALMVRAIDNEELESSWSSQAKVSLVAVELPRGALMMGNGAIQLPEGQKVKLRNTDGLETAINDMGSFMAPPSEMGLLAGKAQTLRIRRKGESDELRVRLEPRSVQAVVELGPRNARWPDNPVSIAIKLATPDGRTPLGDIEVVPKVLIDVEPINLEWARDGGVMRATVTPRGDGKPHIVRVEVSDQYGFYLGRNHLEIASSNEKR